ncbi:MAG: SlyX family protein [Leptolyngbyaceae cyanobacterium SM2_5_2]|nr:SlyX family protein [Leptolyngbyaceae cyanobacterium SM2_5_2]
MADSSSSTICARVSAADKQLFHEWCKSRGSSMSEQIEQFIQACITLDVDPLTEATEQRFKRLEEKLSQVTQNSQQIAALWREIDLLHDDMVNHLHAPGADPNDDALPSFQDETINLRPFWRSLVDP